MLDLEIRINGTLVPFKPGDTIDLGTIDLGGIDLQGKQGMICWHDEPTATAIRIITEEHQKSVRRAIEFVESKQKKQHGYGD